MAGRIAKSTRSPIWAREHELPYFDDQVHFPDFRIEYELDGRDRHEDVEVDDRALPGGHAASRARAGFTCVGSERSRRPAVQSARLGVVMTNIATASPPPESRQSKRSDLPSARRGSS